MTALQNPHGYLLIDGARFDDAVTWLVRNYPGHRFMPLLQKTAYAPIAEAGPIILDAPTGSAAQHAWLQGEENLINGVWLQTQSPMAEIVRILQRRIRIYSPERQEYWLRLGDALPLRHAWLSGASWPPGFWFGIESVWLHHESMVQRAWTNDFPHIDSAPADTGIDAQIVLDWPLLKALATETETPQEAV
ncbi:DUF4123 domain-containing protein [Pseudomonas sp. B21-015]|uniref:DUF4123 domain-containing protein n=1 Tax=Pseudomonas sp. B21-015 TaxID=2895473 RepID=UPI00215DFE54|nr:DUF4123 domain-containing protein [Pseudomonas sp. B21-015]UVM47784.1 DUF4123 domain-containing protein [Pseudomonas sp. B21-015]